MAFNLVRNSRVFFTSNVNSTTGVVQSSGNTYENTFELQVLDGFSFSQNTSSETVTVSEAGSAPIRGQMAFNTSLEPVDFSFTTYMRPRLGGPNSTITTCEERVLWNAIAGTAPVGTATAAWSESAASAVNTWDKSNAHQLQKFGMIIVMDSTVYFIDNCALDQASIDFGIDAIASIQWTGRGTVLRQSTAMPTFGVSTNIGAISYAPVSGPISGTVRLKDTTANYIANKLSVATVFKNIGGTSTVSGNSWNIAITGGNLTIANNLTYLTPANLGVVNQPITYFTGTRAVSGSLNAYLKTGTQSTSELLTELLSQTADDQTKYRLLVQLGGTSGTRVELDMAGSQLSIPTVNTEQVVSTTLNFTAQPYSAQEYDLEGTNELVVKYYSA